MPTCQHAIFTCGNGKEMEVCVSSEGITFYPDATGDETTQYNLGREDSWALARLLNRARGFAEVTSVEIEAEEPSRP
jgi:hypothetical protein